MKRKIDILIRQGLIHDGSGSEPYTADIAVLGDRILHIGQCDEADADIIIPADGLAVSPGFIDSHAHSDFTIVADPRAEGKIFQGVTTEITGNCGMSAAPLYNRAVERREADLLELGIRERWNSVGQYRKIIEKKGMALNIAMLIGHGNIRGSVIGYDDAGATGPDIQKMKEMLEASLSEGGIGLSTGLIYPPGIFSSTDELADLSAVLRRYGMIYTSHMRSEGDGLLESLSEVVSIGQKAGIRVHISHIKTAGRKNWPKADSALALIAAARENGQKITSDRYPYVASSTDLDAILPSWVYAGGNDEELLRLASEDMRIRIRHELSEQIKDGSYWDSIVISSVSTAANIWMEGRTITEISRSINCDGLDAVFRILSEEKLRAGAIFFSMNEDNLKKFLSQPYCAIGSDSSARSFDGPTKIGKPHPRTFGTFPRFLGSYVRELGLMSMPEAVRRLTKLPADIFGLNGRGMLNEGYFADIAVFDPKSVADNATFENPFQPPSGIHHLLVNGALALHEGIATGRLSGRMLASQG